MSYRYGLGLGVELGLGSAKPLGASPGASLWTPAELIPSGIMGLWLDAQDTSTIVEVVGRMAQWSDKSGNVNHALQTIASRRPVFSGAGQTAKVRFTNSSAAPNLEHMEFSDVNAPEIFFVVSNVRQGYPGNTSVTPLTGGNGSNPGSVADPQNYFLAANVGSPPAYTISVDGGVLSVTER